jgi:hypothetical protein
MNGLLKNTCTCMPRFVTWPSTAAVCITVQQLVLAAPLLIFTVLGLLLSNDSNGSHASSACGGPDCFSCMDLSSCAVASATWPSYVLG